MHITQFETVLLKKIILSQFNGSFLAIPLLSISCTWRAVFPSVAVWGGVVFPRHRAPGFARLLEWFPLRSAKDSMTRMCRTMSPDSAFQGFNAYVKICWGDSRVTLFMCIELDRVGYKYLSFLPLYSWTKFVALSNENYNWKTFIYFYCRKSQLN